MINEKDLQCMEEAIEMSRLARRTGNAPYGAVLADKQGNVLMTQSDVTQTEQRLGGHAVVQLLEKAMKEMSRVELSECTLYVTVEPCYMCAGAVLVSGVGRVVYGMSKARLAEAIGMAKTMRPDVSQAFVGHEDELTVEGPIPELEKDILSAHEGAWSTQGAASGAMAQRVYHWHKH